MSSHTDGFVEIVIKLGGRLMAEPGLFGDAVRAIGDAARAHRLLVVPGGGAFADMVRQADRRLGLSDDAAHWMGVLAMDQSGYVVAEHLTSGVVVTGPGDIESVLGAGQVPVLAPFRWLQQADPLPHSWDVTSDSIAAWIAGCVGARRLVLIKPPGVGTYSTSRGSPLDGDAVEAIGGLVDAYLLRALPEGMGWTILPADRIETLGQAILDPTDEAGLEVEGGPARDPR